MSRGKWIVDGKYSLDLTPPTEEEDYPNQHDEYRMQRVIELAIMQMDRILDRGTKDDNEYKYAKTVVLHKLTERVQGDAAAKLLSERLQARFPALVEKKIKEEMQELADDIQQGRVTP